MDPNAGKEAISSEELKAARESLLIQKQELIEQRNQQNAASPLNRKQRRAEALRKKS